MRDAPLKGAVLQKTSGSGTHLELDRPTRAMPGLLMHPYPLIITLKKKNAVYESLVCHAKAQDNFYYTGASDYW